jgi:hypothetical protein
MHEFSAKTHAEDYEIQLKCVTDFETAHPAEWSDISIKLGEAAAYDFD